MLENSGDLVAFCGLYCGTCGTYVKGKCKGCKSGGGFNCCPTRACCEEHKYLSCGSCAEFPDPAGCGKVNSFVSKLFALFFKSDRLGSIRKIREVGIEEYARLKSEK